MSLVQSEWTSFKLGIQCVTCLCDSKWSSIWWLVYFDKRASNCRIAFVVYIL